MAKESFNAKMVRLIREAIEANPMAPRIVTVDGTSITMTDAEKRLEFYEERLAEESGARQRVVLVPLDGGGS
jgi:hypothetical protein